MDLKRTTRNNWLRNRPDLILTLILLYHLHTQMRNTLHFPIFCHSFSEANAQTSQIKIVGHKAVCPQGPPESKQ